MINIESTHIDPESGCFEVKLLNFPNPIKFLVGEWSSEYIGRIDEFVLSHPDVTEASACPTEYHLWNPIKNEWDLPNGALDKAKSERWSFIKKTRTQAEWGGFQWDGSWFDSDPASQQRLTSAVTLSQISSDGFVIDWVLKNNNTRTLSKIDLISVGSALGTHVANVFEKSQNLRNQINSAKTVEEVLTVNWT